MTLPNDEILKKTHQTSYKGLFVVYNKKKFIRSVWIPCGISLLVFISIVLSDKNVVEIIKSINSVVLGSMPSLLGFVLGGYAIIIGFGNEKFMKSTAKITAEKPISYYQNFSSVFAFSILSLSASLVLAFVFYLFSLTETPSFIPDLIIDIVNYFSLFCLIMTTTYSIFQIPVMIINIFSFSQTHHINLVAQNLHDSAKEK
jgi:uncharacterized protein YqhQ